MENCCICGDSLSNGQPIAELTLKGSKSSNRVSSKSGDNTVQAQAGQSVYQNCRQDFCRLKKLTSKLIEEDSVEPFRRRSVRLRFSTKEHCIFCGQPAKNDERKGDLMSVP